MIRQVGYSIITIILLFTFSAPAQRSSRKSPTAKTPQANPRPETAKSLFHWIPPNASGAIFINHPGYMEQYFAPLLNFLSIPVDQCTKSLTIKADTPGQFLGPPKSAYIIETGETANVMRAFAAKRTPTVNMAGETVLAVPTPSRQTLYLARIDDQHLLFGENPFFSEVLSTIRGRRASLYSVKSYVRPVFDVAQRSPLIFMMIMTPEALKNAKIMLENLPIDIPELRSTLRTLLDMRVMAIDFGDAGKCGVVQHLQFEHSQQAVNSYAFTGLMKLLSQELPTSREAWKQVDVKIERGTLVSIRHNRTDEDCAPPLITGRLRVKDPDPKSGQTWNITGALQGSTVSVMPADNPDSEPLLVMPVIDGSKKEDNGKFSSKVTIRGKQTDLIAGKRYILRCNLKYKDNISINNLDEYVGGGCAAPPSHFQERNALLEADPILISRDRQPILANIDYPLPIVLIHGIRSCWQGWNDWVSHLLTRRKQPNGESLYQGYIVFTPNYQVINYDEFKISRQRTAEEVIKQMQDDFNGLFLDIPKMNIIAHSNGGIVSRVLSWDPEWTSRIKKIYTLGTPHTGTALALSSYYELSYKNMSEFNKSSKWRTFPPGLKVFAISGTADKGLGKLQGYIIIDPLSNERHDGIVFPQKLSYIIGSFTFDNKGNAISFEENQIFDYHEKPVYHSDPPGPPAFLDSVKMIFEPMIYPDMMGSSSAEIVKVQAQRQGVSQSIPSGSMAITLPKIPFVVFRQGRLQAKEAKEFPFTIPLMDSFSVIIQPIPKGDIVIADPSGKSIRMTNPNSYPGASSSQGNFGETYLTIAKPKSGEWKLKIKANNSTNFQVAVAAKLDVAMTGGTDKQNYQPDSQIVTGVGLYGQLSNISVSSVQSLVYNSRGDRVASAPLNIKSAGTFEGILKAPLTVGYYYIVYTVQGTYKGKPFQLESQWDFSVGR